MGKEAEDDQHGGEGQSKVDDLPRSAPGLKCHFDLSIIDSAS